MTTDKKTLAFDVLETAAIELWHRFASESVLEWEDEIHKAEYRFAAQAVIDAVQGTKPSHITDGLREALELARNFVAETPHGDDCFVSNHYEGDPGNECRCGKEWVSGVLDEAIGDADEPALARIKGDSE